MLEIVSFAELVDLKEAFFCWCWTFYWDVIVLLSQVFFFFFFTAYANSPIMQFRTMMFNLWYSLFTLSSPHYTSMTCHPHFSCFLPIVKSCFVCCLPLPCEILFCLLPPFATQATDFKWNLVGWKYHTASWHGSEKSGRQDSHWISQIGHLCWFLSVSVSVNSFMTAVSALCLWSCIMCTIRLLTVTESMRFPLISTVLKISIGEKQPSLVWTWEMTK